MILTRRCLPLCVALAAVHPIAVGHAAESADPIGLVTGVVGIDVEIRRPEQAAQYVQLGLPIRIHDEVFVPADHAAMILLSVPKSVLQVRGPSLIDFRSAEVGVEVRITTGLMRALAGEADAARGLTVSTALARSSVTVGVVTIGHTVGETAGGSESVFRFESDGSDTDVTVERIDRTGRVRLSAGQTVSVSPMRPFRVADAGPTSIGDDSAGWTSELPLAAARVHRLRVADDVRNDIVQRTALAAALRLPTSVARQAPQSIVDQPAVQPRGPSQVVRIPIESTAPRPRATDTIINQLARQNVGNLLGLVPGRGPVPTQGPNSLIQVRNSQR